MQEWKHLRVKASTHDRIKRGSEATGVKMWALADRMVENYFKGEA